jgi:hypothetical protein
VDRHPDDVLFPSGRGELVVFLGKEALLSWFSDVRSEVHQAVLDRFYYLGHRRVSFTTSAYQLIEVFTKIRYDESANTVGDLYERITESELRVLHGGDGWGDQQQERTPRDVFEAASGLFQERRRIQFSFPEAALVLSLARENKNRRVPVYLFTFDGTLATLADTFGVPVLPFSTPLRDDGGR